MVFSCLFLVIVRSFYLENDSHGNTPLDKEFSSIRGVALQMLGETEDHDLAYHPTVRVVVDKKMSRVGNYYLWVEILYFIVFLFCLFYILTTAAVTTHPLIYSTTGDIIRAIFEIVVAVFWVLSVLLEIFEVVGESRQVYQKILVKSAEKNRDVENSIATIAKEVVGIYIKDPYNYFDIIGLLLLFLILPMRLADISFQWVFGALAVVIHFLRFIKVLRLLPGFGTYVHTITLIIIKDVPKFVLVSGTIILVGAEAFFIAIRAPFGPNLPKSNMTILEITGDEGLGQYNELYWAFLLFMRLLLQGENVLDGNFLFNRLNWLDCTIYLVTLTLVIVVLLNIFIAQVRC